MRTAIPSKRVTSCFALIGAALLAPSSVAYAQGVAQCDGVLTPAIESRKSDYALLQAYAKVNASELYDEIAKDEEDSAGGGGRYGPYSADYKQSSSRSDFMRRVENRLAKEKFQMSESDARSYYRKGVSGSQISAWSDCVARVSDGGAVLLSARNVDRDGFHLVVTWIPPINTGQSQLELRARGGTVAGNDSVTAPLKGRGSKTYEVLSTNGGPVKVSANIAGSTDALMVTYSPPTKMPTPKVVRREKTCSEDEECRDAKKVSACLSSSDKPAEVQPGIWLVAPSSSNYASAANKTRAIEFGDWENSQCGLSGSGWHAKVGSCGTGAGSGWQRCDQVRVETETVEYE